MSTVTPGIGSASVSRTVPVTVADATARPRAGAALHRHTIASHIAGDQNFDRIKAPPASPTEPALTNRKKLPRPQRLLRDGSLATPQCGKARWGYERGGGDSGRAARRMADGCARCR